LIESQEYQNADVVFITDGKAPISKQFLDKFLETKKEKEFFKYFEEVELQKIQSQNVAGKEAMTFKLICQFREETQPEGA